MIMMTAIEEFKANLPEETSAAVASMLIRLVKEDVERLEAHLSRGEPLPTLTIFNIQHAFAEAGYPDMNWKRIMTRYERMGHTVRHDFD